MKFGKVGILGLCLLGATAVGLYITSVVIDADFQQRAVSPDNVDDANAIKIPQEHVDKMIEYGEKMIPALRQNRVQKSNPQVNNNPDHRIR